MENTNDFKILVVDDIPELLDITSRPLLKANYQVFSAVNGAECIEVLEREKPDIILLDLMLPDVNGIDLSKTIKNNPEFSSIYIILMSSIKILSKHAAEGLENGADGYIARPVDKRELLARVEAACRIIKAERDLSAIFIKTWEATFGGINEALFLLDKKGVIQQANNSSTLLFEKSAGDLIGKRCCDILNCLDEYAEICPLDKAMESKMRESAILRFGNKWIEETIDPILDSDCNLIGAINIMIDYSEQEEFKRKLSLAEVKVKESDHLKTAFLQNISHEIRTPLNGILGFSNLLKDPDFTGEQQLEFLQIIEENGYRMLNTINDIIEISKIETGQVELIYSEINVNNLLHEIYSKFRVSAEKKGLGFKLSGTLPKNENCFQTDVEKLNVVLTHLIDNAIKFTKTGEIEFGCKFIASDKTHDKIFITNELLRKPAEVEFFVKDTGMGIPEELHQTIFDRFVQVDIKVKNAIQGSGLGLSISKAFVELIGGRIWHESIEEVGSTFYFSIPVSDFGFSSTTKN